MPTRLANPFVGPQALRRKADDILTTPKGPGRSQWYEYIHSLSGLKSYWRFGEPSGTTAIDEMGTAKGTYTNPALGQASAVTTDPNTAVLLDGTSAFVTVTAPPWTLGDTFTIAFWAKRTATGGTLQAERLYDRNPSGDAQIFFDLTTLDHWSIAAQSSGTPISESTNAVTDTNWHWYVWTKATTTSVMYFDGAVVTGAVTNVVIAGAAGDLMIGRHRSTATDWFNGQLDEYFGSTQAMTATQVSELYAIATNTGAHNLVRDMVEAVTSLDAWNRSGSFLRDVTGSVQSADVLSRLGTFKRDITDTVQSADVWSRAGTWKRSLTEAVASADLWTRSGTFLRGLTESVQSADVWTRSGTFLRGLTESVAQSDIWVGVKTFVRGMTESVTSSDVWTRAGTFKRDLTEAVQSGDIWARAATSVRAMTGAVQSSDVWARVGTFKRDLTETVQSADAWVGIKLGAIIRSWSESVTHADVWTRSGTFKRTLTEAVTSLDSWAGGIASSVIGGIGRGFAYAMHAIPRAIASHLPGVGSATTSTPSATADHETPDGEADHEVPR